MYGNAPFGYALGAVGIVTFVAAIVVAFWRPSGRAPRHPKLVPANDIRGPGNRRLLEIVVADSAFAFYPGGGSSSYSPSLAALDFGGDVRVDVVRQGELLTTGYMKPMYDAEHGPCFSGFDWNMVAPRGVITAASYESLRPDLFQTPDRLVFHLPRGITSDICWGSMTHRCAA